MSAMLHWRPSNPCCVTAKALTVIAAMQPAQDSGRCCTSGGGGPDAAEGHADCQREHTSATSCAWLHSCQGHSAKREHLQIKFLSMRRIACSCRTCCSMARPAPAKPPQPWQWLGSSLGELQKMPCRLATASGSTAGFAHQNVSAMFTGHASATSSVQPADLSWRCCATARKGKKGPCASLAKIQDTM